MNWDRVRREDQTTVDRRADREANSLRKSFTAKYKSTCGTCDTTIKVGDLYASTIIDGKRIYHHERCIYPSADVEVTGVDDAAAILAGAIPDGRCHGITKAGKPCAGGAKKGELYCGPHLDKMTRDEKPKVPTKARTATQTTSYDPYYDNPF